MKHTNLFRAAVLAGAALLPVIVGGCDKGADGAAGTPASGSPAPAASPLDARIQALADAQAKGREADALKQAEAMKKLNQK